MRCAFLVSITIACCACGDANPVIVDAAPASLDAVTASDTATFDAASGDAAAPLVWHTCDTREWSAYPRPVAGVKCATIEVPLHSEGTATITLRVARLGAKKPTGRAIFFPAGGPGSASVELSGSLPVYLAGLTSSIDMVFVDQRGTGGSGYLGCTAGYPRSGEAFALCYEEHKDKPLAHYLSINAADDIEAVRKRLAYEMISLRGGSYGTRIALEYLRRYPRRVESLVLDGVAPANYDYFGQLARQNDEAIAALVTQCAADVACRAVSPQLQNDLVSFEKGLPLELSFGGKPALLDRETFHVVLGNWLSQPQTRYQLPRMIHQHVNGNRQPFNAALSATFGVTVSQSAHGRRRQPLQRKLGYRFAQLGREPVAAGVFIAMLCSETLLNAGNLEAISTLEAAQSYGHSTASDIASACAKWRQPFDSQLAAPIVGSAPVLLLSGALDTITPPKWAEEAKKTLSQATHLVVPHTGHSTIGQPCVRSLIEAFITSIGKVGDTSCLAAIQQPRW